MKGIVDKPQFDLEFFKFGKAFQINITSKGQANSWTSKDNHLNSAKIDEANVIIKKATEFELDVVTVLDEDCEEYVYISIEFITKGLLELTPLIPELTATGNDFRDGCSDS